MIEINIEEILRNNQTDVTRSYSKEDIKKAADCLDMILLGFSKGMYHEGNRNNMAVDLTCVCHVLYLDPIEVVKDHIIDSKLRDLKERVSIIEPYTESWDSGAYGIFEYMIDEWYMPKSASYKFVKIVD